MRAPSLKKPDTFTVYTPFINSTDFSNNIYLAGVESGPALRFPAGTKLTRVIIGGYCGDAGPIQILSDNEDLGVLGIVAISSAGNFAFDVELIEPVLVDATAGVHIWYTGLSAPMSFDHAGGMLILERTA